MITPDTCPFCRGCNIILMPTEAGHYYHACTDCGGTGPSKCMPVLATEFWNMRGDAGPADYATNSAFNQPYRKAAMILPK